MRKADALILFVVPIALVLYPFTHTDAQQGGAVPVSSAARTAVELPEPVIQANHSAMITVLLASFPSALLASGSRDGTVKVWSLRTRELLNTLAVSQGWIRS